MAKKGNTIYGAWDGLNFIVKIIVQLIFGWPISALYRIIKGIETSNVLTIVFGILCLPFGFIFWILDLICTIIKHDWLLA